MTSVSVISAAAARIEQSAGRLNVHEELLKGLKDIKKSVLDAYESPRGAEARPDFNEHELEAVRLADEIADAITAEASSSKSNLGGFNPFKRTDNSKAIKDLQKKLTDLRNKLKKYNEIPPVSEIEDQSLQEEGKHKEKKSNESVPSSKQKRSESLGSLLKGGKDPGRFKDDLLNQLREDLMDPEKPSEMYLVGKSGMGKTTLARELFNDVKLRAYFEVFAWVPMTHNFQIKRVLHVLLHQLSPELDIRAMNEIELITKIFPLLNKKKYLIVLDDIKRVDDWESIHLALPKSDSAKVIITCAKDIAPRDQKHTPYNITGFSEFDILSLLRKETPFISDNVGKVIYDISGGSPLYATILGKSLNHPKAIDQDLIYQLRPYETETARGTSKVLGACYKRLDPELKPCLLYLALFPEGEGIEVGELYSLLAAENLIIPQNETFPTGDKDAGSKMRKYLDQFASWKLVQVQEDIVPTMSGLYKSCSLHEQVRDFCILKATQEEFIEIVDSENSRKVESVDTENSTRKVESTRRRLAVYLRGNSNSSNNPSNTPAIGSNTTLKKLYTLVVFGTSHEFDDHHKSAAEWPLNDLTESSHLRILNFKGVNFTSRKLPKGLERLSLLRYLSFRGCLLRELPSSLGSLTQLETLDLTVHPDCEMVIPSNLFTNMTRMVHLYFPRLYKMTSGSNKVKLQHMQRLETLVNFNTEIFDADALSHPTKLKILSTISRGNSDTALVKFLEAPDARSLQYSSVEITGFDSYNTGNYSALVKLLQCKHVNSIRIDGRIGELPKDESSHDESSLPKDESSHDDQKIWEINLEGSQLQLDPMTYFGKFESLQRLVLGKDAYLGTDMHISPLKNLRSLKLHNLQYLEKLTIQNDALPKLSALQIHSCDRLNYLSIPTELHARLLNTRQGNIGDADAYSVMPSPITILKT